MTRYRASRFEQAWGEYIAASDDYNERRQRTRTKRERIEELEERLRRAREQLEELEDEERFALDQTMDAKQSYEQAMLGLSFEELGAAVKRVLEKDAAKPGETTAVAGDGQKGPLST